LICLFLDLVNTGSAFFSALSGQLQVKKEGTIASERCQGEYYNYGRGEEESNKRKNQQIKGEADVACKVVSDDDDDYATTRRMCAEKDKDRRSDEEEGKSTEGDKEEGKSTERIVVGQDEECNETREVRTDGNNETKKSS
jgi:hypothetical protein